VFLLAFVDAFVILAVPLIFISVFAVNETSPLLSVAVAPEIVPPVMLNLPPPVMTILALAAPALVMVVVDVTVAPGVILNVTLPAPPAAGVVKFLDPMIVTSPVIAKVRLDTVYVQPVPPASSSVPSTVPKLISVSVA
jgi:hypothetical protein